MTDHKNNKAALSLYWRLNISTEAVDLKWSAHGFISSLYHAVKNTGKCVFTSVWSKKIYPGHTWELESTENGFRWCNVMSHMHGDSAGITCDMAVMRRHLGGRTVGALEGAIHRWIFWSSHVQDELSSYSVKYYISIFYRTLSRKTWRV